MICVSMCVYVSMCVSVFVHMHASLSLSVCVCECTYVCSPSATQPAFDAPSVGQCSIIII